jgi:hypothetical protein
MPLPNPDHLHPNFSLWTSFDPAEYQKNQTEKLIRMVEEHREEISFIRKVVTGQTARIEIDGVTYECLLITKPPQKDSEGG